MRYIWMKDREQNGTAVDNTDSKSCPKLDTKNVISILISSDFL